MQTAASSSRARFPHGWLLNRRHSQRILLRNRGWTGVPSEFGAAPTALALLTNLIGSHRAGRTIRRAHGVQKASRVDGIARVVVLGATLPMRSGFRCRSLRSRLCYSLWRNDDSAAFCLN